MKVIFHLIIKLKTGGGAKSNIHSIAFYKQKEDILHHKMKNYEGIN